MHPIFPEPIRQLPQADIPLLGLTAYLSQADTHQILFMEFKNDVELPEHSHGAQMGIVLEGQIELIIGGEKHSFSKGDRYIIPEGVTHSGTIYAGYADVTFFAEPNRYSAKQLRHDDRIAPTAHSQRKETTQVCKLCGKDVPQVCQATTGDITGEICPPCCQQLSAGADNSAWLEAITAPVLLMQGKPRQVITANRRALALFGKELPEVAGHRGGQVFDCQHSFTEAGCGLDVNCADCKIKGAIVATFTTDTGHRAVSTTLPIHKNGGTKPYRVQVSTQKIGDLALVRIECYESM